MFTAKQYRAKSKAYAELSKKAADGGQIRIYQDSSDSFSALADNEEWLAGNLDKTLQALDEKLTSYISLAGSRSMPTYRRSTSDGGSA